MRTCHKDKKWKEKDRKMSKKLQLLGKVYVSKEKAQFLFFLPECCEIKAAKCTVVECVAFTGSAVTISCWLPL